MRLLPFSFPKECFKTVGALSLFIIWWQSTWIGRVSINENLFLQMLYTQLQLVLLFFRLSSNNRSCDMGYFTAWCCVQVSVSIPERLCLQCFPHSLAVTSIPPPRFTSNFAAVGYRLRQEQFGHSLALDWQLFLWVDFILFASFASYSSFLFTVPSSFESSLVQGLKCFNNAN